MSHYHASFSGDPYYSALARTDAEARALAADVSRGEPVLVRACECAWGERILAREEAAEAVLGEVR